MNQGTKKFNSRYDSEETLAVPVTERSADKLRSEVDKQPRRSQALGLPKEVRSISELPLNLRERPDKHANSIIRLAKGYVLTVLGRETRGHLTWINVKTKTGIEGYVLENLTEVNRHDNKGQ